MIEEYNFYAQDELELVELEGETMNGTST